jgi:hypothetical protein
MKNVVTAVTGKEKENVNAQTVTTTTELSLPPLFSSSFPSFWPFSP